jgi:hypothetical protein
MPSLQDPRGSIALDAIRRPRDTLIWKLEAALKIAGRARMGDIRRPCMIKLTVKAWEKAKKSV